MAKKNIVTMKAEFPLYCLSMVGDRHLLVAGGGGSAKSGITNAIVSDTQYVIIFSFYMRFSME